MAIEFSQEEIRALVDQLSGESTELRADAAGSVEEYSFWSQERIVHGQLPALDLLSERLARSLRTSLTQHLSQPVSLAANSLEVTRFGSFTKRLILPSSIHLFHIEPLVGQAALVFSPKLSSLLIDVLFGGRGRTRTEIQAREFTAIESRLLAKTAHLIIDEVTQAFQPLHPVQCCYLRAEQSPLALTCATPTERSVVLHFELDLAGQSADFEICIPYSLLEPIRAKLQSGARVISPEQRREALSRLAQSLQHCKTTVRVELARGTIRAEQALGLGVGDVLTLATHRDEPALVYIEGQPKFRARVGSKAGQWAVTITDEIKSK